MHFNYFEHNFILNNLFNAYTLDLIFKIIKYI